MFERFGEGSGPTPKRRTVSWLAVAFIVLSFLPYAAVPLGNSTNIPLAAIAAALLTLRLARSAKLTVLVLVLCTLPFIASLLRQLFENSAVNANAYFTAAFGVLTFFGAASMVDILRERAAGIISSCISTSAVLALIQKYVYLDNGVVPLIELYNVPGYASVAANAQTIALYIRRPFGLFPEPSFLAGTLALGCAGYLLLIRRFSIQLKFSGVLSLVLATIAIYVSDSGSAVICIAVLAIAALSPFIRRNRIVVLLVPIAVAGAVWLGLSIVMSRQDGVNTSWNDRLASILGGGRLWTSDPVNFLLGVGRGMAQSYFQDGRVPFGDMPTYSVIPDIYSVLGRIVLEHGLLFGLSLLIWMGLLILRLGGLKPTFIGALFVLLWIVVAGLTISYETASWIWILPGMCLGHQLAVNVSKDRTPTSPSNVHVIG